MRVTKYLVCADQRDESRVALRLACMRAKTRGSMVDILHVLAPVDFQSIGAIADRMREERRAEAELLLKQLAASAIQDYGISPNLLIREGLPGEEIITMAMHDPDINMVVIGVASQGTGRGTLTTWLASQLGSKLLIPLLMVPGNLTDEQLQGLI